MEWHGHLDGRLAWLNNGRCQYEEALAAAEQGSEYPDDLGLATWSVVELIEAAVRSGRMERATLAFCQLSEATLASGSDWAIGVTARCRALVTEGDKAELLYIEAIERLGRTGVRVELARAHLLYGEWLRRAGRRLDARRELSLAYGTFNSMCVDGFAERARRELLATGETVRKRSVETFGELNPPGGIDIEARWLRLHQYRDQHEIVPERTHCGVASPKGVHQARDPLEAATAPSTPRTGRGSLTSLSRKNIDEVSRSLNPDHGLCCEVKI